MCSSGRGRVSFTAATNFDRGHCRAWKSLSLAKDGCFRLGRGPLDRETKSSRLGASRSASMIRRIRMPYADLNGAHVHFTDTGGEGQAIVFSHGLLFSGAMFEAQVAVLRDRFRCITFDHRGQGRSGVTPGGYDMDTLTSDAVALIRHLGVAPCHFVGLSMGGHGWFRRHPPGRGRTGTAEITDPSGNLRRPGTGNRTCRNTGCSTSSPAGSG